MWCVPQGGKHSSFSTAVRAIWAEKGVRGFYQGYTGQIARDVPFRAIQMVTYELIKDAYYPARVRMGWHNDATDRTLSGGEGAVLGGFASAVTAAATTPLDVIKTRLMTNSAYGATNVVGAVRVITAKEGLGAWMRGIVPRVGLLGPSCAIFFMVYEYVHTHLH